MPSLLSPTQRYAAGALFALALHQAQVQQSRPSSHRFDEEARSGRTSTGSSGSDSVSEDSELWVHETSDLLRPIFRFLGIESQAWNGLEETAGSSPAQHHVEAFLRLLAEDGDDGSSEGNVEELALSKAADAMTKSLETFLASYNSKKEKYRDYENERKEKCSTTDTLSSEGISNELTDITIPLKFTTQSLNGTVSAIHDILYEIHAEEVTVLTFPRKVTVLHELLSACLANVPANDKKPAQRRKGYDARHRAALRILAAWFDLKWIKMEAIETIVACSAMALANEDVGKEAAAKSESSWTKWRRGGVIGAAALTGGTLMAITGGLAAPAIAAGFGALAPTLGTLVPVIGASGFAAAASAAGTVTGSVAVAASFGAAGAGLTGSKMARRTGSVDEFEFKLVGENHNQGRLAIEIMIAGFVFEDDDFIMPWKGYASNLERYAVQWESKNLIAVSTAIQDWLTSKIAMEMMKQGAMLTVLSTLLTALAWPATLLAATDFIDSKWAIALDRSDKAGKLLADILLKGLQGYRPVTLVGFSLGARLIFKCLQVLAQDEHNAGLVEKVVLLGAPISIKDENWEAVRKIVAGRFVNVYATNDWMLGVAFRASLLAQGLAGIQAVDINGIENVDVGGMIEGHSSYLWATGDILEMLQLDSHYPLSRSPATVSNAATH